ncbi:MAG: excinuclease ABC subunit UvrC [Planctomycetota bacterium]
MRQEIVDKVAAFPNTPGVYLFTRADGKALYVGKATKLRNRVRSYLKPGGDGRPLLRFLEREAHDVEFLAVSTEQEALLLENTVIKKRKPLYNVKLKDDKAFLMLRLDRGVDWPWFWLVRRRRDDGAEYFGPFASAKSVRRTLQLLHKVVPLRDCRDGVFLHRSRPCIKFEIGRCPAPCVGKIDREDYDRLLDEACSILRGKAQPVLRRLRIEMAEASERLEFERAQVLKDQVESLERVAEAQSVVDEAGDQDVFGLHRAADGDVIVAVLMFRRGRLESARRFELPTALPDELLLSDLVTRIYDGDRFIPSEVLVSCEPAEVEMLEDWLSEKRRAKVSVRTPQRGKNLKHLRMAEDNARLSREAANQQDQDRSAAAEDLAELLDLQAPPQRIHCIDVSTTQGRNTVASRVCFVDGRPSKDGYRRFEISDENAGDDFSAMTEAVGRSLNRCRDSVEDLLPDLLIIDGGRGQLSAAMKAVDELAMRDDLFVCGLAKAKLKGVGVMRQRSQERLVVEGRETPIFLEDDAQVQHLVTAVRDEAHRFAITYHRKLRGRVGSELDAIPGIGPTRRRNLLRHFGSLEGLKRADADQVAEVPGIPRELAEQIVDRLATDRS